MSTASLPSRA